jgi:hypothetical protein
MVDMNAGRVRRRCRACFKLREHGAPMTPDLRASIIARLESGSSVEEIARGVPTMGGPKDSSLKLLTWKKLHYARNFDPELDAIVRKHTADSGIVAGAVRRAKGLPAELKPTMVAVARLKHRIKAVRSS